tara:strand:+ start:9181 stop:10665 length:1485 start_codon:yes stop_codon:yes gene_type:complete
MADGAAAATNEIAKASMAIDGFTKNVQAAALYTKMYNKAFGPFYDLWIKTKQTLATATEVMEDVSTGFQEMEEAAGPITKTVGMLGKGMTKIVMVFSMAIGIGLALMLAIGLLGGGMGGFGEMLPGIGDALSRIIDGFMGIAGNVMSLVGIIMSLDFTPIIEPLMVFAAGAIMFLTNFAVMWVEVVGVVIEAIVMVFQHLSDTGALQSLIDAIGGLMEAIMFAFGFIFQALEDSGVTFESVTNFITSMVMGFVSFLITSGIIDFIVEVGIMLFEVASIVIQVIGIIVGIVIYLVGWIVPFLKPLWLGFKLAFQVVVTLFTATARIVVSIIRIIVAIFTGDFGKVGELISGIGDIFVDTFNALYGFVEDWVEGILDFLSPVIDAIEFVVDGVSNVVGGIGDFVGGFFNSGGIARGPESGYMATLHGTEAVVPLPDGSSIPVTVKGMGGGGGQTNNINISVSGGGNAREIAQAVSQEVQRAFRTRSRSGGYGRGVM